MGNVLHILHLLFITFVKVTRLNIENTIQVKWVFIPQIDNLAARKKIDANVLLSKDDSTNLYEGVKV